MENQDTAEILLNMSGAGKSDTAMRLLELYAKVMEVYEPSERTIRVAREAEIANTFFSTSANRISGH